MEYLAGGLLSADNECWMLLRHKENQQNYLFKIKITSDNRGTSLAKIAITPEVAPHLQEATHFASLERPSFLFDRKQRIRYRFK